MNIAEIKELFKPRETAEAGRGQVVPANVNQAYEEISNRTGIPVCYFDYRAVSEPNAVTRAASESIGSRFYRTQAGNKIDSWVCFVRVGLEENGLDTIAISLAKKFSGACTTLILFATQIDWTVYKIFFADGYMDQAKAIATIFGAEDKIAEGLGQFIAFSSDYKSLAVSITKTRQTPLPKAFILLAGISGTGKSRFVREQANACSSAEAPGNYCLVPVRPDWHEPADLLGYISRINGEKYVVTNFMRFVVSAWVDATGDLGSPRKPEDMTTHWVCLDEMNLAPVEQYFADFLSVLETRRFESGVYRCDPLLQASEIRTLNADAKEYLKKTLFDDSVNESKRDLLFDKFANDPTWGGIPIPPNLIVAGTVNMDETSHSFSRKVIDRALTLDFQEFYPNEFDCYLKGKSTGARALSFPIAYDSRDDWVKAALASTADPQGDRTVAFLSALNRVLRDTPFELAYRSLNEALLSVACFASQTGLSSGTNVENPGDSDSDESAGPEVTEASDLGGDFPAEFALLAVWDDYLMQKVLPRIEGDGAKLSAPREFEGQSIELPARFGRDTVLHHLYSLLSTELNLIWGGEPEDSYEPSNAKATRPDLLREIDELTAISCRSRKKLRWMMRRLKANHFTNFWC